MQWDSKKEYISRIYICPIHENRFSIIQRQRQCLWWGVTSVPWPGQKADIQKPGSGGGLRVYTCCTVLRGGSGWCVQLCTPPWSPLAPHNPRPVQEADWAWCDGYSKSNLTSHLRTYSMSQHIRALFSCNFPQCTAVDTVLVTPAPDCTPALRSRLGLVMAAPDWARPGQTPHSRSETKRRRHKLGVTRPLARTKQSIKM